MNTSSDNQSQTPGAPCETAQDAKTPERDYARRPKTQRPDPRERLWRKQRNAHKLEVTDTQALTAFPLGDRRARSTPRLILCAATEGRIEPAPCTSRLESSASVVSACLNDK